jgi:hypothetical protein
VPISVIHNACGGLMMPFKDGTCRTCGRSICRAISVSDCEVNWVQLGAVVKVVPRRRKHGSLVLAVLSGCDVPAESGQKEE